MKLLTYPKRKPRTALDRFARMQIGTAVEIIPSKNQNGGTGVLVKKTFHHNDHFSPRYFMAWVHHTGGVGCFWASQVKYPAGLGACGCPSRVKEVPKTEVITWHSVADKLPDSDLTVNLFNAKWSEPVWPGYLDGEDWRNADGELLDAIPGEVPDFLPPTHWSEMLEGPRA